MRAEGYQLCLPTPGPLLLEAPSNAERTSQHALQNKLIYFEEARSGRLTPRLTSPPREGPCRWPQGKGDCPASLGIRTSAPLTAQEGGPPSGQPQAIFLVPLQKPSELKPVPSQTSVGFSVNSFPSPEGLNQCSHVFLHSPGRSANQK